MTSGVGRPDFVGRRRELAALHQWLEAARGGAGRLVLCAGEAGIGKTRLAQELAGAALASGCGVAWGRCVESEGAPAYWPWTQVFRSLDVAPGALLSEGGESPEDRFRVYDAMARAVLGAAGSGFVVVLDDIHWADEPSLLVLRQLADQVADHPLLVFATMRGAEPGGALPQVLPDLVRAPAVERIELHGLDLAGVREQLDAATPGHTEDATARAVLDVSGGNPFFVGELARAIAEGSWRPDRPPRSVLDVVAARLGRLSSECARLLAAAAIIGRDFPVALVAAATGLPVEPCLAYADEAVAHGLLEPAGDLGGYRFVHALTRDAVEASLESTARVALHRTVAEAIEAHYSGDFGEHLADLARHWSALASVGEGPRARQWTVRAADEAVRRLGYEEGVRLYRAALDVDPASLPDDERCRLQVALGRALYFAGDLTGCADAARAAADAARAAGSAGLLAESALVLEAAPDPAVNATAKELCEQALAVVDDVDADPATLSRLLAQRSHLAFYDGEQDRTGPLSSRALELARRAGDDRALVEALRARQESLPGPGGRTERLQLSGEMLAVARRTRGARTAMWGHLWRLDALVEGGRLEAGELELTPLELAVDRVGGPVSRWHLDRCAAAIAQGQARYADANEIGRRAFERMRAVESAPARGAYLGLQCALSHHVGIPHDASELVENPFTPPARFVTMGRISRAFLLLRMSRGEDALASYQQAGPPAEWTRTLPVFFVIQGLVIGAIVAVELGRTDDVVAIRGLLAEYRGEHAVASGGVVSYLGPVELHLGVTAAALGQLDAAVADLTVAVARAERAGAPGFVAEARYHLASALATRDNPGDRQDAATAVRDSERLVRSLGMTAYAYRVAALLHRLGGTEPTSPVSRREAEVADLVAEGLTNRQIAERLVISERTAQNHVQHILTKLGFTTRSQIAAWRARGAR